jgi:hypothetical protein
MKRKCIEIDKIASVLKLPADDERRQHLEQCPRCASRLLLYERYLSGAVRPGADPEDADLRLAAVMKSAIDRNDDDDDAPERGGFFARVAEVLAYAGARPAWAAAAVIVVVVAAAALVWRPWSPQDTVLRDGKTPQEEVRQVLVDEVAVADEGAFLLSWRPFEGADGYAISVRTPELAEIARFGPVADTSFVLRRALLPLEAPSVLLWRVVALRAGDEIGRSRPASLKLP